MGKDYSFKGMPFGFVDAQRLFTHIMRKVTAEIRRKWDVRVVAYLDDLLFLHQDQEVLKKIIQEIISFLESLGLLINKKKCNLIPSSQFSFLGFEWNTTSFDVCLTEERKKALRELYRSWERRCLRAKTVRVKDFALFVGKLSATRFVLSDASLHLQSIYKLLQKGVTTGGWDGMMKLNASILLQIRKWRWMLMKNPVRRLTPVFIPEAVLTTDASESSWGATLRLNRMSRDCHSRFPFAVKNQSSNFRELKAVELALTHFAPILAENRISQLQLRSDNSAVVFNVNRWNAGRNLRQTLKRIWTLKEKLKIVLRAVHLPGLRNTRTDALSRLERAGDYSIADSELKEILSVLQVTPTLDAFAAQHNHKVYRWCGIGSPLGEEGLAYPWKNECVLAHPPVPLIPMTIRKAQKEKVPVVLLLPNWKWQNWDVLLEKTPHRTFEWRSLRTVLRKGPSMASTGACLPPGRLRVILINPPELKARAGGEGRWKKDLSQFHWQRSAYLELLSRRGMDIYSALHTLENSGKRVIWA
ncbi:putative Reverse transcriptase (RNA-dependent DNA polymerase) [Monocercomonoides exilis]|uniref:putative Reverse transcriptase (RNA-dependent DNA polymerase) n=1 Tax=Monocercomonoides exilis TaxID=2049356 RepID=UPI0035593B9D|nr:putative Reverse transcriptase (RNA-dependent DNA polymerase) [Monocercomonoides exilis]|eukprot:MONOS_16617.1-p1 / transcript=MONOS_16617.1 / gene=MONOS_16617 / organism=Monocercomonoides_exilis_PA203 / gene_product=ORF3 / transcript_product=ORF3 / location=Mono_scaffold01931:1177-2763(-) / protein_length=528 / sequence_SO=supercontig / SO=protein_coding / is_pseudo=false